MNTPRDLKTAGQRIVYVKAVQVADLPKDIQASAEGLDHLYAVHDADGQPLALVANRNLAFVLARQNDMTPVTVHCQRRAARLTASIRARVTRPVRASNDRVWCMPVSDAAPLDLAARSRWHAVRTNQRSAPCFRA